MRLPRLDLLIYAHDGRGLGHASRGIAVGMAVRRLFPEMRVLFVSGCRESAELIAHASLEWIKLPSYESLVVNGRSRGQRGYANFTSKELGVVRAELIRSIVGINEPRCVLVDHSPQGKHRELLPALANAKPGRTKWVLGMRAVIGDVNSVWSDTATSMFKSHYQGILWYGDSTVLGDGALRGIEQKYGVRPVEVGYVSRIREMVQLDGTLWNQPDEELAGTVSVPWMGETTFSLVQQIARTLEKIGDRYGKWHIYLGSKVIKEANVMVRESFERLPFCFPERVGPRYIKSLLRSRVSLIYGGYNSLTDVLSAKRPSVVILRGMQDREQEDHAAKLAGHTGGFVFLDEREADSERLYRELKAMLESPLTAVKEVNLNGAENAARYLVRLIQGN